MIISTVPTVRLARKKSSIFSAGAGWVTWKKLQNAYIRAVWVVVKKSRYKKLKGVPLQFHITEPAFRAGNNNGKKEGIHKGKICKQVIISLLRDDVVSSLHPGHGPERPYYHEPESRRINQSDMAASGLFQFR